MAWLCIVLVVRTLLSPEISNLSCVTSNLSGKTASREHSLPQAEVRSNLAGKTWEAFFADFLAFSVSMHQSQEFDNVETPRGQECH